MRSRRTTLLAPLLAILFPASLAAQGFNLRDLLTQFPREGITLAPPASGISHVAHFIGGDSPQFLALRQLNSRLATQLSSFPLASSAGGFTYRFDPSLGVFTRSSESFGPIYAERSDTIGKGKFNIGLNYSHFSFDQIDGLALRDGELNLVFTHQDVNFDGSNLLPHVEGDVITARLFLKIETDITAFVLSYGVSDRFDIGVAVPLVSVDLEAQMNATVRRLATGETSNIHAFVRGGTEDTLRQSGTANGVGDVVLRGKFQAVRGARGGLALAGDLRLPTGEERDLLGAGATQAKGSLVGSLRLGPFSPHLNAAYTWSTHGPEDQEIADEISAVAGFDWAIHPRMTLAADAIGRSFRDSQVVRVENTTFQFNTNPAGLPIMQDSRVLPRLLARDRDSNTLLGSIGLKINPFGNLLLTFNGLFPLNDEGLQDDFAPLVAIDYSF